MWVRTAVKSAIQINLAIFVESGRDNSDWQNVPMLKWEKKDSF